MLIPLKSFWMSFKILHFTTTCLLFKSISRFFSTEEGRRDGNVDCWEDQSQYMYQAGLSASVWESGSLCSPWLLPPPSTSFLPPPCVSLGFHPLSVFFTYFFETFVPHWSTFCSLCCYKFVPLLWVLGRLNFIFEKSKRIEMKKKKKVSCHIPIGIP